MIKRVDFPQCDVKGSECYIQGVANFARGQRQFSAHVSTATSPHLMVSFSINEPGATSEP
jgi:hypothetical protein